MNKTAEQSDSKRKKNKEWFWLALAAFASHVWIKMTLIVSRLRKYSSRVQDLVVECETNKWLENRRHRKITSNFDKAEMSIKQKHTQT